MATSSPPVLEKDYQIAHTILEQMGGIRRLSMMIGCRAVVDDLSVTLKFIKGKGGCNTCVISYNEGQDLYGLKFYRQRGLKCDLLREFDQAYCDQLVDLFETTTDLYLHF